MILVALSLECRNDHAASQSAMAVRWPTQKVICCVRTSLGVASLTGVERSLKLQARFHRQLLVPPHARPGFLSGDALEGRGARSDAP
jgi:hypothetical protein